MMVISVNTDTYHTRWYILYTDGDKNIIHEKIEALREVYLRYIRLV